MRLAAVLVALLLAAPALAAPQDVANDIAREVTSPFCPGVTLHDCPSRQADRLRDEIARRAESGWSRDRIEAWLASEYGVTRMAPPSSGSGLVAWLVPFAAAVAGLAVAWVLARRWTGAAPAAPTTISDEQRARLEAELEAMRSSR